MSVGVLLITHNRIGDSLVQTAEQIFGQPSLSLPLKTLGVTPEMKLDQVCEAVHLLCDELNQGEGVLILADQKGATPCNAACKIRTDYRVRTVAGLNLSMLLKVVNYASLDLDGLAHMALSGAHEGIVAVETQQKH